MALVSIVVLIFLLNFQIANNITSQGGKPHFLFTSFSQVTDFLVDKLTGESLPWSFYEKGVFKKSATYQEEVSKFLRDHGVNPKKSSYSVHNPWFMHM